MSKYFTTMTHHRFIIIITIKHQQSIKEKKEYEEKEEKVKRYEAEFEYAGAQYEIKGVVEKEEFEKILKNLYFF